MRWMFLIVTLAAISCGDKNKNEETESNKFEDRISEKGSKLMNLTITDETPNYSWQDDCKAKANLENCHGARIVGSDKPSQTVKIQYAEPNYISKVGKTEVHFKQPKVLDLKAQAENTLTTSQFRGEDKTDRVTLTVEGDYCWFFITNKISKEARFVRNYNCNLKLSY
mgnify:CR=1 FL=1